MLVTNQIKMILKGTQEVINLEELEDKLKRKEKLIVKLGIDPTANSIHLGFAVVLRKFRLFQDLGHDTYLVLGDFTALIGDPSGKSKTRPMLTKEEIEDNLKTYFKQLAKIIDLNKTKIVYNSSWLNKLSPYEIISLASKYTLAQMLEREDFKNRYLNREPISLHELMYPLFQAYDSVYLKADVELGGIDQKFNFLVTRYIQEKYDQEPEVAVMMPILEGLDGVNKMSKSLNNYVGIDEDPLTMFSKIMTIPDNLIYRYYELCTNLPTETIEKLKEMNKDRNPRDVKLELAKEIVSIYHSEELANQAFEEFIKIYSKKDLPSNIPIHYIPPNIINEENKVNIIDLLYISGIVESKSEAKRLISQGGVYIIFNDTSNKLDLANKYIDFFEPMIIKIGKFNYYKIEKK